MAPALPPPPLFPQVFIPILPHVPSPPTLNCIRYITGSWGPRKRYFGKFIEVKTAQLSRNSSKVHLKTTTKRQAPSSSLFPLRSLPSFLLPSIIPGARGQSYGPSLATAALACPSTGLARRRGLAASPPADPPSGPAATSADATHRAPPPQVPPCRGRNEVGSSGPERRRERLGEA